MTRLKCLHCGCVNSLEDSACKHCKVPLPTPPEQVRSLSAARKQAQKLNILVKIGFALCVLGCALMDLGFAIGWPVSFIFGAWAMLIFLFGALVLLIGLIVDWRLLAQLVVRPVRSDTVICLIVISGAFLCINVWPVTKTVNRFGYETTIVTDPGWPLALTGYPPTTLSFSRFAWAVDTVNWFFILFIGTAIFERIRRFRVKPTRDTSLPSLR
jgi:hypothetical protein